MLVIPIPYPSIGQETFGKSASSHVYIYTTCRPSKVLSVIFMMFTTGTHGINPGYCMKTLHCN